MHHQRRGVQKISPASDFRVSLWRAWRTTPVRLPTARASFNKNVAMSWCVMALALLPHLVHRPFIPSFSPLARLEASMHSIPRVLSVLAVLTCFLIPIVTIKNSHKSMFAMVTFQQELASILPQGTSQCCYDLAIKQSFGFFDYIADEDWKFRQRLAQTRQDHPLDGPSTGGSQQSKLWYLNHYYPSFTCPHTVRVGREPGDGPKFICDPHRLVEVAKKRNDTCLIYSIGSKGRFEFENGLVEFTASDCEIHVIDPGNYARITPKNMIYHKWGHPFEL